MKTDNEPAIKMSDTTKKRKQKQTPVYSAKPSKDPKQIYINDKKQKR